MKKLTLLIFGVASLGLAACSGGTSVGGGSSGMTSTVMPGGAVATYLVAPQTIDTSKPLTTSINIAIPESQVAYNQSYTVVYSVNQNKSKSLSTDNRETLASGIVVTTSPSPCVITAKVPSCQVIINGASVKDGDYLIIPNVSDSLGLLPAGYSLEPLAITVSNIDPSPTASPAPTASPNPTVSPAPTPSPTVSPTPTPAPSPTPPGNASLAYFIGTGQQSTLIPGPAVDSPISNPQGIAIDSAGNVFISATNMGGSPPPGVVKVNTSGIVSVYASGIFNAYAGSIALDQAGNLYVSDGPQIHRINLAGNSAIIAGNGAVGNPVEGPALNSPFEQISGMVVDNNNNLLVSINESHRVVKINSNGVLTYYAGNGVAGDAIEGTALNSPLNPKGIDIDTSGNLYISAGLKVLKVNTTGNLSVFAGGGVGFESGTPAVDNDIGNNVAVAVDNTGAVYILNSSYVDRGGRLLKVMPDGNLYHFAGSGVIGEEIPGVALNSPASVSLSAIAANKSSHDVYFADWDNNRVLKVTQ